MQDELSDYAQLLYTISSPPYINLNDTEKRLAFISNGGDLVSRGLSATIHINIHSATRHAVVNLLRSGMTELIVETLATYE